MKFAAMSDPHITYKTEDAYRKDVFRQWREIGEREKVDGFLLTGDLTEEKDNHPSKLVNEIVDSLHWVSQVKPVTVVPGNHDGLSHTCPFFGFTGKIPGIRFMRDITTEDNIVYLPHTRDSSIWKGIDFKDKIVFAHVTVKGVVSESLYVMQEGEDPDIFKDAKKVFSGDIHKPQDIKNITYIGSPYNIRFGDNFDGRILIVDTSDASHKSIKTDFPRKLVINVSGYPPNIDSLLPEEPAIVKIRYHVDSDSVGNWRDGKKIISDSLSKHGSPFKFELIDESIAAKKSTSSVESADFPSFKEFCKLNEVPDAVTTVGEKLISKVKGN